MTQIGPEPLAANLACVFVYGTLKRGFPNFEAHLDHARFMGKAVTTTPYRLVMAGRWRTPMMINENGEGAHIWGELFAVDPSTLAKLDQLEQIGEPGGYIVAQTTVLLQPSATALKALTYLKQPDDIGSVVETLTDHYPLDPQYVPPRNRN